MLMALHRWFKIVGEILSCTYLLIDDTSEVKERYNNQYLSCTFDTVASMAIAAQRLF